jgi:hypothetical protein
MNKKVIRSVSTLVVLAAVAGALGCGSGGGSEPPPSKEAFIRKVNLICVHGTGEKEKLVAEGVAIRQQFHGHVPQKRKDQYNAELMEIYEGEAERITELTPPAGDEKKIEAMANALNEGAERYKANPEAGGIPFAKASRIAQGYGFDRCVL